ALWRPSVNRQTKGALGDERVTSYELERRARRIRIGFVVARRHPDFALVLDAHLRRPNDVPRWMERDTHTIDVDWLTVVHRLDCRRCAKPRAQHALALARAQVVARAPARVVAMRVRDDRALDAVPRIDVKIARLTVEPARVDAQKGHVRMVSRC